VCGIRSVLDGLEKPTTGCICGNKAENGEGILLCLAVSVLDVM